MKIPGRRLRDGSKIPALGLGTWMLTGRKCREAVKTALELGYRHIDTAEAYGNQKEIGKAIDRFDRTKLFLTSKVWHLHLRYDDVIKACEETLKELKTDYLDLYLIHWPNRKIDMKEVFDAMEFLKAEGKVRNIGVSNFTVHHLQDILKLSKIIANNQVEFHPGLYQKELLEFCKRNRILVTAYSPLGRGSVYKNKTMVLIARKYSKTAGQVSLRWLLQKGMAVIPKASSEEHLRENMDIFGWSLSKEDERKIDGMGSGNRIINPSFAEFDY